MTLSDYLEPRVFRSPYLRRSESVSGASALWALLLGPAYYWRKQAPVEALLLFMAQLTLYFIPDEALGGVVDTDTVGVLLWLGAGLAAPLLLSMCYERKGWFERRSIDDRVRSQLALGDDDSERDFYREQGAGRSRPF